MDNNQEIINLLTKIEDNLRTIKVTLNFILGINFVMVGVIISQVA